MHTVQDLPAILSLANCPRLVQAASLAATLGSFALVALDLERTANATDPVCDAEFDVDASYPVLPATADGDINGEAGVVIHLQSDRGVVEIDDCLYELDRPLEINFAELAFVSLLFEVHTDAGTTPEVFVTDGSGSYEMPWIDGTFFTRVMLPHEELGFELASQAQMAPTIPVVIAKPVETDPPPAN